MQGWWRLATVRDVMRSDQWHGLEDGLGELPDATRPTTSSLAHINSMKVTQLVWQHWKGDTALPREGKAARKRGNTAATNTIWGEREGREREGKNSRKFSLVFHFEGFGSFICVRARYPFVPEDWRESGRGRKSGGNVFKGLATK